VKKLIEIYNLKREVLETEIDKIDQIDEIEIISKKEMMVCKDFLLQNENLIDLQILEIYLHLFEKKLDFEICELEK
jgi:hypothetical protein